MLASDWLGTRRRQRRPGKVGEVLARTNWWGEVVGALSPNPFIACGVIPRVGATRHRSVIRHNGRKLKTSSGEGSGDTMTSWRHRIVSIAVAVAMPLIAADSQSVANVLPRPIVRLLGVFDDATGDPVGGAQVVDLATKRVAVTSVSGAISLAFLPPGVSVLLIRKIGYAPRFQTVTVSAADTVSITMALEPRAQVLPGVRTTATNTTSGRLATFELHRAGGFGHFLTQDQLEKAEGHLTSDVFRRIPGVWLRFDTRSGAWYVASFRSGGGGTPCPATVVVDGTSMRGPFDGVFDINSIRPEEMAGVEFYAGGATTPIAYGGTQGGGCGTVLIWTR